MRNSKKFIILLVFFTYELGLPKARADVCHLESKQNEFITSFDWNSLLPKGSICRLTKDKFDELMNKSGTPLAKAPELDAAIRSSDVVVAGETHLFTDLKARTDIIEKLISLKGPGVCVAFELPKNASGLDAFMKALQVETNAAKKVLPTYQIEERNDLLQYYNSMIQFSESKGIKTFGVDHPDNFSTSLSNAERNPIIAQNIENLIRTRECSSVLLFIGKAHETKENDADPAISRRLKAKSLKVTTINVQMSYEYSLSGDLRTWACTPPSVTSETVLKASYFAQELEVLPGSGEKIRFRDFDFTLLVPFSQRDYPCSGCLNWPPSGK